MEEGGGGKGGGSARGVRTVTWRRRRNYVCVCVRAGVWVGAQEAAEVGGGLWVRPGCAPAPRPHRGAASPLPSSRPPPAAARPDRQTEGRADGQTPCVAG